jgi:hypothetical protein
LLKRKLFKIYFGFVCLYFVCFLMCGPSVYRVLGSFVFIFCVLLCLSFVLCAALLCFVFCVFCVCVLSSLVFVFCLMCGPFVLVVCLPRLLIKWPRKFVAKSAFRLQVKLACQKKFIPICSVKRKRMVLKCKKT